MGNAIFFDGVINYRGPIEEVGEKKTLKRTIGLIEDENDSKYPQSMAIDLFNDKVDLYPEHQRKVGDTVRAYPNFKYRNFKAKDGSDRLFNGITLWKMEMQHEGIGHMDKGENSNNIKESLEQSKENDKSLFQKKETKKIETPDDDLPF